MFLIICFLISQVLAIRPRVLQGCTTLNTNVYCLGGYVSALGGQFVNTTNELITFNTSNVDMYSFAQSIKWSLVNNSSFTNSSALEPRAAMAITSLNATHFIVSGGDSDGNSPNNPTIIFDGTTNTSFALSAPPFSTYAGSLVATDSNTVWGYGGQLYNKSNSAPNSMLKLNISALPGTWLTQTNSSLAPPSSRYGHAVVAKNNTIYYFGGFLAPNQTSPQSQPVPFKNIDFYNTATDQWGSITTSGPIPTSRKYHTATLIDDESVLIYGGTAADKPQSLPVLDYSYIFGLKDHTYRKISLTLSDGAGPRSGHSAVLHQQNIFILFGYDSNGNIQNDVHLLDVSDPIYPVWAGSNTYGTGDSYPMNVDDNHTKVIVGAAVGGAALIFFIAGAICYRRKKKNQQAAIPYEHYVPPVPQNNYAELTPISSSPSPDLGHNNNNNNGISTANMTANNNQLPGYPSEPAPRYSLHEARPEISKANHHPSF